MQASISASKITDKTLIIVEGNEDENFLKSYIETLGYPEKLSENPLRTTSRVVQAIGASSVFHRVRRA